jgi:hypothetical protein
LLLAGVACAGRADPVKSLVQDLEAAAEARDAEAIRDRLTDDFRGTGGVDRAEAYATLRRYFAAYESVRLEVYDLAVTRGADAAEVRLRVEFKGAVRRAFGLEGLLPPSASYLFDLRLVRTGDAWRVGLADWRSAVESPAPQ